MVTVLGSAAAPANAAPPAAQTTVVAAAQAVDLPVTGTLADGTPFVGALSNLATSVVNGALMLSGTITGTGIPAAGTPFTTGLALAPTAVCPVLDLNLQPLNLDLLGLVVDLSAINLDITAVTGPGKLLGNLVCSLAGAADMGGLVGIVSDIFNQLLPALGLAPVPPVAPVAPVAPVPPITPAV